ncbi:hypothetical protein DPMN_158572 [Dreissena polymorpha]|uniref:Uncharacterized protein n=1 Tax=Dreissena polymorpha TaxID=45954 RepID=A0A9D4EMJ9_DREPO|nr:hypothetical protein DPMN_158572 [Dreissena polymorpha]
MPSNTSWPRTLAQMLNMSYLHGEASLILGLQTLLLWGQDYLIHKRAYTHKFRPRERCSPTTTQLVRLNRGHPS